MKINDIDKETKATLELLIRELKDILDDSHCTSEASLVFELNELLDLWVKGNDLHPERVQILGPFSASNAWNYVDSDGFNGNNNYTSFWVTYNSP